MRMVKKRTVFFWIIILLIISSALIFFYIYIKRGLQGRIRIRSGICDQFSFGDNSEIEIKQLSKNVVYKKFYSNGKLVREGVYKHSYPVGIHKMYFPSGQLKKLITYKYDATIKACEVKHGNYEEYYENGNVKTEGYYKNNIEFIKGRDYFGDGTIKAEYNRIDGKLQGQHKTYYFNGQVSSIGDFKSDNMHYKDIVFYDEEGFLTGKYSTDVGFRNEKLYYRSEGLKRERTYRESKLIKETCYDKRGNVLLSCSKMNKDIFYSNSDIWKRIQVQEN